MTKSTGRRTVKFEGQYAKPRGTGSRSSFGGYNNPKMYLPSKKDPDLATETRDVRFKCPFHISTNNTKPLQSRFLMSLRTSQDFNDPNKLSSENTVEAILERERQKNPYALNKELRNKTRNIFGSNKEVMRLGVQNDGYLQ